MKNRLLACAGLFLVGAVAPVSAKRNDDRLVLQNGDSVVGEIKKLEQGVLFFKPDYVLDAMQVDWGRVRELSSLDRFRVMLNDGQHFTGQIARLADGRFTVAAPGAPSAIDALDVVNILPVETSIWAQLTGDINSGFSFTNDQNRTQFSASGSVGYTGDRNSIVLDGSSTFNSQTDTPDTLRETANLTNQFLMAPQWFAVGLLGLLSSDQQDLNLRTTAGGGVGRFFLHTDHTEFGSFGGLVYTHESYSTPPDPSQPGSQITNNLEAVLGVSYSYHRFKTADLQSRLTVYPSLTTPGRVRLNFSPTFNFELVRNLYWNFTLYENYDSKPPVNANKNDFGVTNSLGWKF